MGLISYMFQGNSRSEQAAFDAIIHSAAEYACQTGDTVKLEAALRVGKPTPRAATMALGWALNHGQCIGHAGLPLSGVKLLHEAGASLDGRTKRGWGYNIYHGWSDPFREALRLSGRGQMEILDYCLQHKLISVALFRHEVG